MMLHLRSSGALQDAHANPLEEAMLPRDLPGNIMACREVGLPEEHSNPVVPEERPCLAARERPSDVERGRQLKEL